MKDLLVLLKILTQSVDLGEQVEAKIRDMTINFSFVHLFYIHFSKVCSRFTFECIDPIIQLDKSDYTKTLKGVTWLLFVLISSLHSNARTAAQLQ
jgi:hypothetical protein